MQAPLAVIGFLLGSWAWWQTGLALDAVGAVLMLANLPVTLLGIMPTNNRLMAMTTATPEARPLIVKWGASCHPNGPRLRGHPQLPAGSPL